MVSILNINILLILYSLIYTHMLLFAWPHQHRDAPCPAPAKFTLKLSGGYSVRRGRVSQPLSTPVRQGPGTGAGRRVTYNPRGL